LEDACGDILHKGIADKVTKFMFADKMKKVSVQREAERGKLLRLSFDEYCEKLEMLRRSKNE
jgi:hypothetical protein